MRFNEKELAAVALQPLNKFDKQGSLIMKEKLDGLFRQREVNTERWCRLRGNMLFYFKNKDQYSEPTGILILEKCAVYLDPAEDSTGFTFTLSFDGDGSKVQFVAPTEAERDSWIQCLHMASYEYMRCQLRTLQEKLRRKCGDSAEELKPRDVPAKCSNIHDIGDSYLEMCVACDNLMCDGDGLPPSTFISVTVYDCVNRSWDFHSQTEIVQKCSNPCFMTTVKFKMTGSDETRSSAQFKLTAYDVRERLTLTMTILGSAAFQLREVFEAKQCRLRKGLKRVFAPIYKYILKFNPLSLSLFSSSVDGLGTGFVSVTLWQVEMDHGVSAVLKSDARAPRSKFLIPLKTVSSRLTNLDRVFDNVICQTYRFHTGLGADLSVHEIMGESRLTYTLPHNILQLYIKEEKDLLTTLTSLGELKEDWSRLQLEAIERHLHLINSYNWALEKMESYAGLSFKPSSKKGSNDTEFVPVNLHLQRMWVLNDTTKKSGVHDVITVGGFCAHTCKFSRGGLLQLQSKLRRNSANQDPANAAFDSQPLEEAYATVVRVGKIKEEVDGLLDRLIELARSGDADSLNSNVELIADNANLLLRECDNKVIEATNQKLEMMRVSRSAADSSSAGDCELNGEAAVVPAVEANEDLEPLDLTRLNVEASVLCMTAKVRGDRGMNREDYVKDLAPSVQKLRQAIQGVLISAQVAHALSSLSEPSKHGSDRTQLQYRRDVVFSHSLTALVTALLARFWCDKMNSRYLSNLTKVGVLAQFEGLMSCHSEEMGMIEDMVVAVRDLEDVTFKLTDCRETQLPVPTVSGKRSCMTVELPFPADKESRAGTVFKVTPVFLNVGINEQASFAERFGDLSLQDTINAEGVDKLRRFAARYQDAVKEYNQHGAETVSLLVDKLSAQLRSKKMKNVDLLHTGAEICRQVDGLRLTSCKSAKDRTSMSVTLEQCLILRKCYDMADHEFLHALECMRSEGTRVENTLKNAGVRKYAFNSLQLMSLPRLYRPPAGTYGNVQT